MKRDNATQLAKLVASKFDPSHLNSKSIVVIPEIDETLILEGWDEERQLWKCSRISGEVLFSGEIADYVMLLRVTDYIAHNRLTVFRDIGESRPMFTDLVIEMATEWESVK